MKKLIYIFFLLLSAGPAFPQVDCFKLLSKHKQQVFSGGTNVLVEDAQLSNYNFVSNKKAECYCINKTVNNGQAVYSIKNGGSDFSLTELSYPKLIDALSVKAERRGRNDVYLDLSGFTKDEHAALISSCDNRLNSKEGITKRVITNDRAVSENIRNDFFIKKPDAIKVKEVNKIFFIIDKKRSLLKNQEA